MEDWTHRDMYHVFKYVKILPFFKHIFAHSTKFLKGTEEKYELSLGKSLQSISESQLLNYLSTLMLLPVPNYKQTFAINQWMSTAELLVNIDAPAYSLFWENLCNQ
jgi:hypothetical protein